MAGTLHALVYKQQGAYMDAGSESKSKKMYEVKSVLNDLEAMIADHLKDYRNDEEAPSALMLVDSALEMYKTYMDEEEA